MDSIPGQIFLQVILILINAFFASAEIAVLSLNGAKLKKMADDGDKTAVRLLKLSQEPAGFLSTIQVGITLAGFLGSAFAADNFAGYLVDWLYYGLGFTAIGLSALNTVSVILVTLILSYFTLIFGELVPKRIAMQKAYAVARIACPVVSAVAFVMKPVVAFLSLSTNGVLRLLRLKTEAEEEQVTEEEIRLMVDLGEEKGILDKNEKEWIHNVFKLDDKSVREIMVPNPDVIRLPLDAQEAQTVDLIRESGRSRIPIYDKTPDDIVGILYARDFLMTVREQGFSGLKSMIRPAFFVPENMPADLLFKDMQMKKQHLAVVIDEFGEVSGIVTLEDLLEEIVGNIYDESDPLETPEIISIDDRRWLVGGDIDLDTLQEATGLSAPEDGDFDTLGGLIYSHIHTIPGDGSQFELILGQYKLSVQKVENRRIRQVEIEKLEEPEHEAEFSQKDKED